ncbi:Hypothetical protein NTJ_08788 [Nesidiocoris tenuis]|uniref:Uncharacterized protein n=1 Tax=Nesidiocoris tenuis TaxID=355587 RepID=A0ABN7AUX2_9HEMI|nr:Hypothetical protein NTJ_08788 [Nesidiocoris tenuis]
MLGPKKKISLMDITPDAYPSVLEFIKTFTSKRFKTIQNFINFLTKNGNVHEKYKCKVFYKVHVLAVRDDWLWKGLEKALITGALRLSSIMGLPRLAGVFTTYKNQCYMSEFKAVTDFEIYYSEWRTDRGLRIFRGTGKTEPRAALMSAPVPESFRPSMDDKELTESPPLTSDRGRRILKTRVPIWNELGINIACVRGNVC